MSPQVPEYPLRPFNQGVPPSPRSQPPRRRKPSLLTFTSFFDTPLNLQEPGTRPRYMSTINRLTLSYAHLDSSLKTTWAELIHLRATSGPGFWIVERIGLRRHHYCHTPTRPTRRPRHSYSISGSSPHSLSGTLRHDIGTTTIYVTP